MKWKIQGVDEITIEASAETVWSLLEQGHRLTEYAFMVKRTTGGTESLDAVRHCDVEFGGRPGNVAERCVELVRNQRIAWLMTEDSFGFGKMFADMGFSFVLEPHGDDRTVVRNETFYRPLTIVARAASVLLMRRKFRAMRRRVLSNLKALAERERRSQSLEALQSSSS